MIFFIKIFLIFAKNFIELRNCNNQQFRMEGFEKRENFDRNDRDEIFSKAVRAGKRTYFFDVKATKRNEYYLTVTESKRKNEDDGHFHFEKHKIFLYKEDFDKFIEGLTETVDFIKNEQGEIVARETHETIDSGIRFEDLSQ